MRSSHKGPCLLGGKVGLTSQTGQPRASGLLGKAGFPASIPRVKKHRQSGDPDGNEFLHVLSPFPNLGSFSPQSLFLPFLLLSSCSPPGCRSSEAHPASEQVATRKDAVLATASPGKPLLASAAEGTPLGRGSSGPTLRPPPSPTPAARPASTAPAPPKASPSREKLPYVPHSPFHLFSYDFEDSPLSTKEKEAESHQESR